MNSTTSLAGTFHYFEGNRSSIHQEHFQNFLYAISFESRIPPLHLSHMQLCFPSVSQYGTQRPCLHCPFSRQPVSSGIATDFGQSAEVPVHRLSCSQVANCASRHFSPAAMYWQLAQQGEFLSLFKNEKLNGNRLTGRKV
jgi:hypothetical protein